MFDLAPRFRRLWLWVRGSIAFVPSLWVLGFIVLALLMRYLEARGISNWLGGEGSFLNIRTLDTARTILASIIGGIISLTVFSFSMVMIVLSQATTTLSPRLLPQLIRDRSHQTTLGLYLGVIVYAYLTMIAIRPIEADSVNSVSVFLALVLVIICLAFFVFFISSISSRIQVGEVIKGVHARAVKDLRYWQDSPAGWSLRGIPADVENWHPVRVVQSGYIDVTLYDELSNLAGQLGVRLFLEHPRADYVLRGAVLFRAERPLTNEELQRAVGVIHLTDNREKEFWYLPAMRHITEVAVKAMSPGINDPGTATEATNLLADLFLVFLRLPRFNHFVNGTNGGDVFFVERSYTDVLSTTFAQLRTYSKADPSVMRNLYRCLSSIQAYTTSDELNAELNHELEALREDGNQNIANRRDRESFNALF